MNRNLFKIFFVMFFISIIFASCSRTTTMEETGYNISFEMRDLHLWIRDIKDGPKKQRARKFIDDLFPNSQIEIERFFNNEKTKDLLFYYIVNLSDNQKKMILEEVLGDITGEEFRNINGITWLVMDMEVINVEYKSDPLEVFPIEYYIYGIGRILFTKTEKYLYMVTYELYHKDKKKVLEQFTNGIKIEN